MTPNYPNIQALILSPTRDIGQQIAEQISLFSKYIDNLKVIAVYGGAPLSRQISFLKKPNHVVIATPGRLHDLLRRNAIRLDDVKYLVLDEADEMLNMGFKEELDAILKYTPKDKNVWLFSATMPDEIRRISKNYMTNPLEVKVNTENQVNQNIEHQFIMVRNSDKQFALRRIIDFNPDMRAVIFTRTKRDAQDLSEDLIRKDYRVDAIHGDLSQAQRTKVMERFKSHSLEILIATDVAARGIDVNDLSHVIHYSLPEELSYYTHRSGRTARAGKKGISISFINGRELDRIKRIERKLKIEIKKVMVPSNEDVSIKRIEKWCEKLVEMQSKGKIEAHLMDKAKEILGHLSKEKLIEKILMLEVEKLDNDNKTDLNDKHKSSGRSRRHTRRRSDNRSGGNSGGGGNSGSGNRRRRRR